MGGWRTDDGGSVTGDADRNEIILVDPQDREIGVATKREVHQLGIRHRAFSIMLIDNAGRVLLQRRAESKYHSGGLWANSCCGHPAPGESTHEAAVRRAYQELGVRVEIRHVGTFTYRAAVGPSMIEHEVDHVFLGSAFGEIHPDPREISAIAWTSVDELARDMKHHRERYVPWLAGVLAFVSGYPGRSSSTRPD